MQLPITPTLTLIVPLLIQIQIQMLILILIQIEKITQIYPQTINLKILQHQTYNPITIPPLLVLTTLPQTQIILINPKLITSRTITSTQQTPTPVRWNPPHLLPWNDKSNWNLNKWIFKIYSILSILKKYPISIVHSSKSVCGNKIFEIDILTWLSFYVIQNLLHLGSVLRKVMVTIVFCTGLSLPIYLMGCCSRNIYNTYRNLHHLTRYT